MEKPGSIWCSYRCQSSSSFSALTTLRVEDFVSLAEFLKGLQAAQGDHQPSGTLTGGGESFFSFCKEEENAPKPKGKFVAKGKWEQAKRQVLPLQVDMILKKGLPKYKARTQNNTLGMPTSKVVVTCLVVCITSTWWVYTGTTSHVCNSLQGFQETRLLADEEIYLWMRDTTKFAVG